MRAAAPSASSSAAGPLALAEPKIAGSSAGAAAAETSTTAGASDRSADSSQQGASGQPFAAALANAQAGLDRKPGTHVVTRAAPVEGAIGDDDKMLQLSSAAALDRRTPPAAAPDARPVKTDLGTTSILPSATASPDDTVATQLSIAVAPDPATVSSDATERLPSKVDGDTGGSTPSPATGSKPRAGKHSQPAVMSDAAGLSTLAAWLGAAAQSSTATAATSGTVSSASRPIVNGADADSSAAALSGATQPLLSIASAAEAMAASSSPITVSTADRATTGADADGATADSSGAAHAADASDGSAAPATGFAPVMQSLSAVTNAMTSSPTISVGVPVAHPSWPDALATQVQWMATRQVQSATLRLSPEHLGPLEVRIDVTGSQINVNFTAHHPDTRDALAQAVPQLRQLFAAGGLNLGEATVRQEPRSSEQSLPPQQSRATAASETVEPVANTAIQRLGLVDEYA